MSLGKRPSATAVVMARKTRKSTGGAQELTQGNRSPARYTSKDPLAGGFGAGDLGASGSSRTVVETVKKAHQQTTFQYRSHVVGGSQQGCKGVPRLSSSFVKPMVLHLNPRDVLECFFR